MRKEYAVFNYLTGDSDGYEFGCPVFASFADTFEYLFPDLKIIKEVSGDALENITNVSFVIVEMDKQEKSEVEDYSYLVKPVEKPYLTSAIKQFWEYSDKLINSHN